jgi:hypothetical protein
MIIRRCIKPPAARFAVKASHLDLAQGAGATIVTL